MALSWPTMAVVLTCAVVVMLPGVSSKRDPIRHTVGADKYWSVPKDNFNYTDWASGEHFYLGDWLFFRYDRGQFNVLEVNKTQYDSCDSQHFLHNYTTGAGRDVLELNETRTYYFISGNGACFSGTKVVIHVEKPPPPPMAAPTKSSSPSLLSTFRGQVLVPALFAIAAVWDSFLLLVMV